jgi:uncharacterized protein (DUF2336 family)
MNFIPVVRFVHDLTLAAFPFLASMGASESSRDRRIWLRVASDHFVASNPSDPEAIEQFAQAMAARLDAADAVTRLEIARKLAPCAQTPSRLLALFESVDSEAGDFILQHAVAYDHRALARAIARGNRRAVAVAKRKKLDPYLVSILAEQENIDVLVALAANDSAPLEGATLARLLRQARRQTEEANDRRLADALLQRRPLRPEIAALFLLAEPNQRVEILLAVQRTRLGRPIGPLPTVEPTMLHEMELAAVARRPDRFVTILAEALDCELGLAQRIVDDPSGEPLAVALAALGAANEVLVRVLISNDLSSGASYRQIRALARLNNALNRNAAMLVIEALRGEPLTRRRDQTAADALASSVHLRVPLARLTSVAASSERLPATPAEIQERVLVR